ncbi:uncharacterized protein TNCV_4701231 [Trichonephila clavipes]|nr:uncharacterized protein TNCV_4701231 [Trichonephila clavipes]
MASTFTHLAPCDFYLGRFIKDCVYVPPLPADHPDIRHKIEAAVARITSDTPNKVWDELDYRLDECCVTNGAHINHFYTRDFGDGLRNFEPWPSDEDDT